jgi:hypothetical protein
MRLAWMFRRFGAWRRFRPRATRGSSHTPRAPRRSRLMQNWFEELKAKVLTTRQVLSVSRPTATATQPVG